MGCHRNFNLGALPLRTGLRCLKERIGLLGSSFLGLPHRILNIELLRGLWVDVGFGVGPGFGSVPPHPGRSSTPGSCQDAA